MEPPPLLIICSIAYLQVKNMPRPSIAMTSSQSSSVASTTDASGMMPALAITMSSRPYSSTATSIIRRTSSGFETSAVKTATSPVTSRSESRSADNPSALISASTRRAPSRANSSAVARPIPAAAPVTTADFPSNRPERSWVADSVTTRSPQVVHQIPDVGLAGQCDERIVRVSPLQTQVKRAQSLNRCGLPSQGAAITTGDTPETSTGDAPQERPVHHVRETVVLIVLSITAVLTAWCGFESAKWSGEMSVAFSEASSSRIEAARQSGIANAAFQADLTVWGVYLQARAQGDTALAAFVEKRFTDHFRVAYQAWIAQGEATSGP